MLFGCGKTVNMNRRSVQCPAISKNYSTSYIYIHWSNGMMNGRVS